eukprot:107864-Rhodomonas_salina.1
MYQGRAAYPGVPGYSPRESEHTQIMCLCLGVAERLLPGYPGTNTISSNTMLGGGKKIRTPEKGQTGVPVTVVPSQ